MKANELELSVNACRGDIKEVKAILLQNNHSQEEKSQALQLACAQDFEEITKLLITHGANVKAEENFCLKLVLKHKSNKCLKVLLKCYSTEELDELYKEENFRDKLITDELERRNSQAALKNKEKEKPLQL